MILNNMRFLLALLSTIYFCGFSSNGQKNFMPPRHISEFTDPISGFNPFVDLEEGYVNEERPPILSLVEAMDLEPDDQNFITQPPFFLKPLKERKLSSSVRDNQKMILSENNSKKDDYPASKRKSIMFDNLTAKDFDIFLKSPSDNKETNSTSKNEAQDNNDIETLSINEFKKEGIPNKQILENVHKSIQGKNTSETKKHPSETKKKIKENLIIAVITCIIFATCIALIILVILFIRESDKNNEPTHV